MEELEELELEDVRQAVVEALQEEGYRPEVEDDGDVSLEAGEEIFYVCFDKEDLEYFRVIWVSESFGEDRRAEVLERVNEISRSFRVAKAYLTDADDGTFFVTCAVETCADIESFAQFLPDYIDILKDAVAEAAGEGDE